MTAIDSTRDPAATAAPLRPTSLAELMLTPPLSYVMNANAAAINVNATLMATAIARYEKPGRKENPMLSVRPAAVIIAAKFWVRETPEWGRKLNTAAPVITRPTWPPALMFRSLLLLLP